MGFHKNNNSQFLFWGRTINDLSSLHSLSTAPPASLSPPNAYTQYTYRHTFTHSFNNRKKANSHRKRITKINFEGCFYCFFPHRRFWNEMRVLVFIFHTQFNVNKMFLHAYAHILLEHRNAQFFSRIVQLGNLSLNECVIKCITTFHLKLLRYAFFIFLNKFKLFFNKIAYKIEHHLMKFQLNILQKSTKQLTVSFFER